MNGRNRAKQLARAHMQQQHGRAHPHPRYGLCVCLLRENELVCAVGFALDPDKDRAAEEEVAAAGHRSPSRASAHNVSRTRR